MAGVKGRGGQKGRSGVHSNHVIPRNGGRRAQSVKALQPLYDAIKAAAAMFSDASECDVDVSLYYCPRCGAWGWEGGNIAVWGEDFGATQGLEPLASVPVDRQKIRHSKNCSANRGA